MIVLHVLRTLLITVATYGRLSNFCGHLLFHNGAPDCTKNFSLNNQFAVVEELVYLWCSSKQ